MRLVDTEPVVQLDRLSVWQNFDHRVFFSKSFGLCLVCVVSVQNICTIFDMSENLLTLAGGDTSGYAFSATFTIFALSVLVATIVHFYFRSTQAYKLALQLPGPEPLPILGNALMALGKNSNGKLWLQRYQKCQWNNHLNRFVFFVEILEECFRLSEIYGHVARGFLGYKIIVFLTDPQDVELILNSNVHLTKSSEYRFFKPWLGDGLLISKGEKWRSHRKLIAPAFHQLVLKSFVSAFNRNSWKLVKRLKKEAEGDKEFDIHDYMSEVTVDILLGECWVCLYASCV